MIFPQIIRQKLLKGVGESSFLTPFSESFSFNFPHFTFFISTDSSSPFLFSCSLSVLTVIFTYFQLFPPFFQPFSIHRFSISTFSRFSKPIFPALAALLYRILVRFVWFLHKSTDTTTTTTFIFFFSYPFSAILLLSFIHFLKLFSFHSISRFQSNLLLYGNRTNLQQPATRKNIPINPATLFLLHAHPLFSFSKLLKKVTMKLFQIYVNVFMASSDKYSKKR